MGQQKRKFTLLLMLFCSRTVGQSSVQCPAQQALSGMAQPMPNAGRSGARSNLPQQVMAKEGSGAWAVTTVRGSDAVPPLSVLQNREVAKPETSGFKSTSFCLDGIKQVISFSEFVPSSGKWDKQ